MKSKVSTDILNCSKTVLDVFEAASKNYEIPHKHVLTDLSGEHISFSLRENDILHTNFPATENSEVSLITPYHRQNAKTRTVHSYIVACQSCRSLAPLSGRTLIFCDSAAGHMIKPGLLYRSANPPALKGKNKNLLPVYSQSNKAWVTVQLFLH
jgi:hypothetical protein